MRVYRIGLPVVAVAVAVAAAALGAAGWYVSRPEATVPGHAAKLQTGPAPEQVAALEREAEKACLCNRASKKGCWDRYNSMTAAYVHDTNMASACAPISTDFDNFKSGETVAVSYSIVGAEAANLVICTKQEARTLEEIWSGITDLPESASKDESNRAFKRADAAVIAAARKMIAGTYTDRLAEHRAGQPSCVG